MTNARLRSRAFLFVYAESKPLTEAREEHEKPATHDEQGGA
jgi:hypothetical protein